MIDFKNNCWEESSRNLFYSKGKISKKVSPLKIGCHVSISGGIEKSVIRAQNLGCNTMQLFSKNSSTWKEKIFGEGEIIQLKKNLKALKIAPVFIHASYLLNLASPSDDLFQKSVNALIEEMKRAHHLFSDLMVPYVIIHPGAHTGAGEEYGIQRIIKALNICLGESAKLNLKTVILLETTAGSGTHLGYSFKHLGKMMEGVRRWEKIGICLDTCHAFTAGYDLSNQEGVERTIEDLDKNCGLNNLKVIHLNDSKYPLGSRKDRHMHIGEGFIGLEGFRSMVNHTCLRDLPFILETPKRNEEDDIRNIGLVKSLVSDKKN